MIKILEYIDWKTGKKKTYELGRKYNIVEKLSDDVCPIDLTPLIFGYDRIDGWIECVNCNREYPGSQEENYKYANETLELDCKSFEEVEKKRKDLLLILKKTDRSKKNWSKKTILKSNFDIKFLK